MTTLCSISIMDPFNLEKGGTVCLCVVECANGSLDYFFLLFLDLKKDVMHFCFFLSEEDVGGVAMDET